MNAHTPEPWSINEWPQGDAEIRIGAVGYPRIAAVLLKYESINGQKANAERIVSCVNACKGINPEAVPDMLEALSIIADYLEMKLDGDNREYPENHAIPHTTKAKLGLVKEAIAKATGKTP